MTDKRQSEFVTEPPASRDPGGCRKRSINPADAVAHCETVPLFGPSGAIHGSRRGVRQMKTGWAKERPAGLVASRAVAL
jgi:hypothetical protein